MEQFIRYGFSAEAIPFYNCSRPGTKKGKVYTGTVHSEIGYGSLTYGIVTELLYLLVVRAMLNKDIIKWSCYKIMFLLGIYDMIDIFISSIISGVFFINGVVYCHYPNGIYMIGSIAVAYWCGSCLTCLLLVFNRLMDLWKPSLNKKLFDGHRIFYWFLAPIVYTLYFIIFTPPALFNPHMQAWFFDPFIRAEDYGKIIFQSILICFANLVTAFIYIYMQFFPIPLFLIFVGELCWMMVHGIPVFVYLTLNKTIQKEVRSMFGSIKTEILLLKLPDQPWKNRLSAVI